MSTLEGKLRALYLDDDTSWEDKVRTAARLALEEAADVALDSHGVYGASRALAIAGAIDALAKSLDGAKL